MGIFDILTDPIENALNITDNLISGEDITKKEIADLLSTGITLVTISETTGIAIEIIEDLMEN